MENFEKLKKTMDEALQRELESELITELIATLKEFENLDKQNVLSMGSDGGLLEILDTAISTTKSNVLAIRTALQNLGRPLSPDEDYLIQQTLLCLQRLFCFYVRARADFKTASTEGAVLN
jgi:hypothetical protein